MGERLTASQRALVEANADLALHLGPRVLPRDPDAVSHAGLALVALAAAYDPARGVPFRAWARTALPGRIIDARRRELARTLALELHTRPAAGPDTEATVLDAATRAELLAVLAGAWLALPPAHRRAVERLYGGPGIAGPSRTTRRHRDAALRAVVAVLAAATGTGRGPRRVNVAVLSELAGAGS